MAIIKINRSPTRVQLRQFGVTAFIFLGLIAATMCWRDEPLAASFFSGLGAIFCALGLVKPNLLRFPYLVISYATFPIGLTMAYLSFAGTYFLIVTPIGLVMRWMGRDVLSRNLESAPRTYWSERPEPPDLASYFRQF